MCGSRGFIKIWRGSKIWCGSRGFIKIWHRFKICLVQKSDVVQQLKLAQFKTLMWVTGT